MSSKTSKVLVLLLLVSALALNIYFSVKKIDPYTENKILLSSLSLGDSYYGRLRLWRQFALKGDWDQAHYFEAGLDPSDIEDYKSLNQPEYLEKIYQQLLDKGIKNQEDWLALAKIQVKLGKTQDAKTSISQAYYLDPVRDDIYRLYLQLVK